MHGTSRVRSSSARQSPLNDGPPTIGAGTPVSVPGGNASDGEIAIISYDCGSRHTISGVLGTSSAAAPSLAGFASRTYVVEKLPSQPANLVLWLKNPQSVVPNAPMPNLGLTDLDARNIAAYLYKLY